MTIDDKTYFDLVMLAQDRCREAAMSVLQLIDDEERQAAVLVNIALLMALAAVDQLQVGRPCSHEEAMKMVLGGILKGLDIDKYLDKYRDQNATKSPQPGGASATKSNRKNG